MDVIWEGVRRECSLAPVVVFQMCMVASFVPPPDARREGCQGHHAMACKESNQDAASKMKKETPTLTAAV